MYGKIIDGALRFAPKKVEYNDTIIYNPVKYTVKKDDYVSISVPEVTKEINVTTTVIKKKYKNPEMSDSTALKIGSLNVANKILKAATTMVGLFTVIDLFIPDPVLGLDEAALAGLTGLLKFSSTLVENKINELAVSDTTSVKMTEVDEFTSKLAEAARGIKNSKSKNINR